MTERQLLDMVRMAWRICPLLAIFLPDRLRNAEVIVREVTRLLRSNPEVNLYNFTNTKFVISFNRINSFIGSVCEIYIILVKLAAI